MSIVHWQDLKLSVFDFKSVPTRGVEQVEQRHDLRPWVGSGVTQKTVVACRVRKAPIGPLPLEEARITSVAFLPRFRWRIDLRGLTIGRTRQSAIGNRQ